MLSLPQRNVLSITLHLVACLMALLLTVAKQTVAHAAPVLQSNGQNLQLIKSVGGQFRHVIVKDGYAYAIVGAALVVIDISNPITPTEVGRLNLSYYVSDLAIADNLLLLTNNAPPTGVHIVSISDPFYPVEVGYFVDSSAVMYYIAGQGNYAYIPYADYSKNKSLQIVDIAKPASPKRAGGLTYVGNGLPTNSYIAVQGNYAYLLGAWGNDGGLRVIDIGDPSHPTLLSQLDLANSFNANMLVSNNYAFVGYYVSNDASISNQLLVLDLSNPFEVKLKARDVSVTEPLETMALVGNYLYWGGGNFRDASKKVEIINVADREHPVLERTTTIDSVSLFSAENHLYSASWDQGLQIFDLSVPLSPTLLNSNNNGVEHGAFEVIRQENNLLYATGNGWMQILDLSTPTLDTIGSFATYGRLLGIDNNRAYLSWEGINAEGQNCYGFQAVDITNPRLPLLTLTYRLGCYSNADDPARIHDFANGRLYASSYTGKLYVFDLTTSVTPTLLGTYEPMGNTMIAHGNYAYLAGVPSGITVLDASGMTTPTFVSNYSSIGAVNFFAASDHYLFAYTNSGQLHILDIANQSAPVERSNLSMGQPEHLVVEGDYIYILEVGGKIHVFDMVDPIHPKEVAYHLAIGSALNYGAERYQIVAREDHKLYVSGGADGLFVLQLSGTLGGKVVDSFGKPHDGVKVTLNTGQTTQTNAQGDYSFASLTPGSYTVKVESSIYNIQPAEQTLRVPSYLSNSLNFTLLPKPLSTNVTPSVPAHLSYIDMQGNLIDFDVPAGAVTQPTTFNVLPQVSAVASGQFFTGVRFDLQTGEVKGSSSNFTFTAPLTITIHYTDSVVAPVTDRNQLMLRWWNGSQWTDATTTCPSATPALHNSESQVLTTTVCQSGQFALFGPTVQHFLPLVSRSQVATSEMRGRFVAQHSGKCLNVLAESQQNWADIIQWPCVGGDNEIWIVRPQGEYVQLAAKHSQKCLNVSNASQAEGAQVIQYSCSGGDNELWRLLPVGDNLYQIVAKHSNQCLTVQDASQEDKAQVIQSTCSESPNQIWRFQAAN